MDWELPPFSIDTSGAQSIGLLHWKPAASRPPPVPETVQVIESRPVQYPRFVEEHWTTEVDRILQDKEKAQKTLPPPQPRVLERTPILKFEGDMDIYASQNSLRRKMTFQRCSSEVFLELETGKFCTSDHHDAVLSIATAIAFDATEPLGMELEFDGSNILVHSIKGFQAAQRPISQGMTISAVNGVMVSNLDHFGQLLSEAATCIISFERRTWRFETEELLADRIQPSLFHVFIKNCTESDLRVNSTLVPPGGTFRDRTQRLFVTAQDAPTLTVAGANELYGYSVVWQARQRTLSCVAQSHIVYAECAHLKNSTSLVAKARAHVLADTRRPVVNDAFLLTVI